MHSINYEYALRVSASVCTCAQFLSGFLICANFIKKGKVLNESVVPFVTGFLSCSLWMYYGMLLTDSTLVSVNALGSLLFATYTWIYYKYTSKKKRVIQFMITSVAIIAWIVCITNDNIPHKSKMPVLSEKHQHQSVQETVVTPSDPNQPGPVMISTNTNDAIDRVGFVCCLTTMLFFAAPLSNLIHVIRTRNTESLPMPLIIMTFLVSAQWWILGRMLRDKFIMYPNTVGCVLSVIQLALFVVYPRKSSVSMTVDQQNYHHSYSKLMDA